jgi:5-methylthioribose kinase
MSPLLTEETVVAYLVQRGVIARDTTAASAKVDALGGGVSNVVLAVRTPERDLVVKQSLPQLRVAEEWLAKQERALTEAAALQLAGQLTPGAAPAVFDVDPEEFTLTIECAPSSWVNWKDELLAGQADPATAAELGRLLGTWHAGTSTSGLDPRFDDPEAFEQLRVDPYYRTTLARHPELAAPLTECIEVMASRRRCLVHGDYSPKNVLAGDGRVWVLDFEVAHVGDPAFDVAFMLNHLLLKSLHRPAAAADYRACADAFWNAYRPLGLPDPDDYVLAHLGALLLARVDGKSPAEYLTEAERVAARALATAILTDRPSTLDDVWPR